MTRFIPVFIASFFLSIHYGAVLYINSSFLSNFFEPNIVSFLFLIGAVGNILLFLFAPRLVRGLGKRPVLFVSLAATTISTLGAALATTAFVAALSFAVYASIVPIVYYCLDIFLEELSTNTKTGEIRGAYLTIFNAGIVLGPLVLIFFATDNSFHLVYLAAALLLIPTTLLALFSFKSKLPKEHKPYHQSFRLPFSAWWQNKNVRGVTLARLALETFYALMVIYVPIYLHSQLGFEWLELGVIFTVMLLPFVIFEWPAGELADRLWGEKEIMSAGFFITGVSLLFMPFLGKLFWIWMIILFISRIGASLIEVMTESYFFKHITASDTGFLSIFRLTRSVGIVFGVIFGALTLNLFSFEKIFFVLAVLVFFGLRESLSLKDTL